MSTRYTPLKDRLKLAQGMGLGGTKLGIITAIHETPRFTGVTIEVEGIVFYRKWPVIRYKPRPVTGDPVNAILVCRNVSEAAPYASFVFNTAGL